MAEKIRILLLAADPWRLALTNTKPLPLDLAKEQQRIQDLFYKFDPKGERFIVRTNPVMNYETLLEKVIDFKPHLIHFSGHGEADCLVFTDLTGDKAHEVTKQALAKLFGSYPDLKAVFLNACYSADQAEEIIEQVDYVVGMNAAINDSSAISFSHGFYTAIFSQYKLDLDIEQAFNAGLAKMEIDNIDDTEQKIPTLLPKTYVPRYKHDIFISFADADEQWTKKLTVDFCKPLKQKLYPADNFQLCTDNDLEKLDHSAILLIISSPAYYQQYSEQMERLIQFNNERPVFFVNYEAIKRPDCLNNLRFNYHELWDNKNSKTLENVAYFAEVDKLALAVADQLQELKTKHQLHQHTEQQRQQQQADRSPDIKSIDAFVFLHSDPEDVELSTVIVPLLKAKGIDYILPLPRSEETKANEIDQDIEKNILLCDAVLILYEKSSSVWIREQLRLCRTLQRDRKKPLKIIAVHNGKIGNLGCSLKNFQIYDCPPENVETYLPRFIEALV